MENNLDSILKMITSNPELMSKISEIASSDGENKIGDVVSLISPLVGSSSDNDYAPSSGDSNESESAEDAGEKIEQKRNESSIASLSSSFGQSIAKNKALLIALKPYLSKERCKMIDSVIKLSSIADVIKLI